MMTTDQPLVCDWQTSRKTVTERALYLFETGAWNDCHFIVGSEPQQQSFKGHKLFLAMASSVFGAMFYGGLAERKDPIAILDVQPDGFKMLLEYIYTDRITLTSFDQACELYYCGKKYMLPHLVEICIKYLQVHLHPKNACKAYEFAKLFEEPILMEQSINIIRNQTREVFSESNFDDVELSTIGIVFEENYLNIQSELELFTAITRYANHQNLLEQNTLNESSTSSITIRDILMKIRFLTLTPQEFAEGPGSSDFLTEPEKFAILMNISSLSINVNMPQGFSTARIRRVKHYHDVQKCESSAKESSSIDASQNSPTKFIDNINTTLVNKIIICYIHPNGTHTNVEKSIFSKGKKKKTNFDYRVNIICDTYVFILGIHVPTQNKPCLPSGKEHETYEEIVTANILNSKGILLANRQFIEAVNWNSEVDIMFDNPTFIPRNEVHTIEVTLHRAGVYSTGKLNKNISNHGVNFTFKQNGNEYMSQKCLIKQVIFKTLT